MTKSKIIALLIIVLAAVATGAYFITKDGSTGQTSQQNPSDNSEQSQPTSSQEEEQTSESKTYTKEEVAKHNTQEDCWTVIDEKVYNVSPYIQNHPGGDEILKACGVDGTTMFTERQTPEGEDIGTGTPHSDEAQAELDKLFIGTVSN